MDRVARIPDLRLPSPIEELRDERLQANQVRLLLKRDDLIHPELPGNKWRKLAPNLETARQQGHTTLLTFGGAMSNHVRATALAGKILGFTTIGVIRGKERSELNPSLTYASACGMRLTYLDLPVYRKRHEPNVLSNLRRQFGDFYLVPEGGSNPTAVTGYVRLATEIDRNFDVICCACATGGTLAGIAGGVRSDQQVIGFSVVEDRDYLLDTVRRLQQQALGRVTSNWHVEWGYYFRGYAQPSPELDAFIADFEGRHGLRLEWTYVAKMVYGIFDLVERRRFRPGTTIMAVITG